MFFVYNDCAILLVSLEHIQLLMKFIMIMFGTIFFELLAIIFSFHEFVM